jgi:hypothetical protein
MITILGGWWAKKTDRAAKITNDNLASMGESLSIIDALKRDVWDWEEWGNQVRNRWRELQETLQRKEIITDVKDLPPIPLGRFHNRSSQSMRGQAMPDNDEGNL